MKLVRHKPELMRTSDHHRQVFLFLITIVVPSLVLIILTWHVIAQQRAVAVEARTDVESVGVKIGRVEVHARVEGFVVLSLPVAG